MPVLRGEDPRDQSLSQPVLGTKCTHRATLVWRGPDGTSQP
jgi:hypothetical protein